MLEAADTIVRLAAERDEANRRARTYDKANEKLIARATAAEAERDKAIIYGDDQRYRASNAEAERNRLRGEVDRLRAAWGDQEKQIDHYAFVLGKLRSRLNKRTRERDTARAALGEKDE